MRRSWCRCLEGFPVHCHYWWEISPVIIVAKNTDARPWGQQHDTIFTYMYTRDTHCTLQSIYIKLQWWPLTSLMLLSVAPEKMAENHGSVSPPSCSRDTSLEPSAAEYPCLNEQWRRGDGAGQGTRKFNHMQFPGSVESVLWELPSPGPLMKGVSSPFREIWTLKCGHIRDGIQNGDVGEGSSEGQSSLLDLP